ncbi:hypothetical protein Tco_0589272 [Tanacetum coccineum]
MLVDASGIDHSLRTPTKRSNLMGTLLVMLQGISLSAEVGGGLSGGVSSPAMVAKFLDGYALFVNWLLEVSILIFTLQAEITRETFPFTDNKTDAHGDLIHLDL